MGEVHSIAVRIRYRSAEKVLTALAVGIARSLKPAKTCVITPRQNVDGKTLRECIKRKWIVNKYRKIQRGIKYEICRFFRWYRRNEIEEKMLRV